MVAETRHCGGGWARVDGWGVVVPDGDSYRCQMIRITWHPQRRPRCVQHRGFSSCHVFIHCRITIGYKCAARSVRSCIRVNQFLDRDKSPDFLDSSSLFCGAFHARPVTKRLPRKDYRASFSRVAYGSLYAVTDMAVRLEGRLILRSLVLENMGHLALLCRLPIRSRPLLAADQALDSHVCCNLAHTTQDTNISFLSVKACRAITNNIDVEPLQDTPRESPATGSSSRGYVDV